MGIRDDVIRGLNALANLKKFETEKIKAQNKKAINSSLRKEIRELKKSRDSRATKITIFGIGVTIACTIIGYVFLVYFPIQNP